MYKLQKRFIDQLINCSLVEGSYSITNKTLDIFKYIIISKTWQNAE